MKMSLQRKFGWVHVRGGRVRRVHTGHAVPTSSYHQAMAAAAEDLRKVDGKVTPDQRFGAARAVFCRPGDLAVEIVNVKTSAVMGWSYLTGPAANLHHYGDSGCAVPWEEAVVPVARWELPVTGDSEVVMRQLAMIRSAVPFGVVAFNLAVQPDRVTDYGRAIAEMWAIIQAESPEASQTCHVMGIINGGKKHSTHAALHFQTKEHASDWPANPFQMGLVLSTPELPALDFTAAVA